MIIYDFLKHIYRKWRELRYEREYYNKLNFYLTNGRRPWSEGYALFRDKFIKESINNPSLLESFREGLPLPERYGEFLDERVVEYPWFLSRTNPEYYRLLDAGSILNFNFILQHPALNQKDITIVNLEPEAACYWLNRISYQFGDIRNLPFKDDWFDETVSISTIEHIGMDNTMIYSSNKNFKEKNKLDFLKAISELRRVTKPGGKVYITVPYGKYIDGSWFQQFDMQMIDLMIDTFAPQKRLETYYCYESGGWNISDKNHCQNFESFNIHETKYFNPNSTKDYDPDYAASSRAIAALELWK